MTPTGRKYNSCNIQSSVMLICDQATFEIARINHVVFVYQGEEWQTTAKEISADVSLKLDRMELESLKQYLENRCCDAFAVSCIFNIYPPITRKRSKRCNELVQVQCCSRDHLL